MPSGYSRIARVYRTQSVRAVAVGPNTPGSVPSPRSSGLSDRKRSRQNPPECWSERRANMTPILFHVVVKCVVGPRSRTSLMI